jgi:hypothetical protein
MKKSDRQSAADDIGAIAETVETLGKMMDAACAKYGEDFQVRLEKAWPEHGGCNQRTAKALFDLERALTPPDEVDKADNHCRQVFSENVKYGGMP